MKIKKVVICLMIILTFYLKSGGETLRISAIGSFYLFQDADVKKTFNASKLWYGLGLSLLILRNIEIKASYLFGKEDQYSSILKNFYVIEFHHSSFDINYLLNSRKIIQPYIGIGIEYSILRQYSSLTNPSMHNVQTSNIGYAVITGINLFPSIKSGIFLSAAVKYNFIKKFDIYDINLKGIEYLISVGFRI